MKEFIFNEELAKSTGLLNKRLDVAISQLLDITRSKSLSFIEGNRVLVNKKSEPKSYKIQLNDVLAIDDTQESARFFHFKKQDYNDLEIVFEDDDVVVVNKPYDYATYRTGNWSGKTILEGLVYCSSEYKSYCEKKMRDDEAFLDGLEACKNGKSEAIDSLELYLLECEKNQTVPGFVSRLDVGTSGLLLVAKNDKSYEALKEDIKNHKVTKIYHALVAGILSNKKGQISAPIARDPANKGRFSVVESGREAVTFFTVLEELDKYSLVEVNLLTGRTHQIRVHFRSIMHPVVGDKLYGFSEQKETSLNRQWLHSKKIEFTHPSTNKKCAFECEYPKELKEFLESLKKNK